jgi:outer membrane murein-binding lipoprotein Lpp
MKTIIILCAVMSAALVMVGCANQDPSAVATNRHAHAFADLNAVGSVYGGPSPGHIKQRFEP